KRLDPARLSRSRDRVGRIIPPSNSSFLPRLLSPFENSPFARQRRSGTPPGAAGWKNCRHPPGRRTSPPVRTTSCVSAGPLPLSRWSEHTFELMASSSYLFVRKPAFFTGTTGTATSNFQPKATWPKGDWNSSLQPRQTLLGRSDEVFGRDTLH